MAETIGLPMRHIERVYFVGIGGAGMGGIAEVLHNLGYKVSGSDVTNNRMVKQLRALGITVFQEHQAAHVAGCDVLVYSSAIPPDNPEILAARAKRIPVVPRAEMLAELMRFRHGIAIAGTHGKTTTTSLVASVLSEGGLDPTFVIGGRLNSSASHGRLGSGRYLVAEADESDASFLHLHPVMAVLTNIDADHMATYGGSFDRLRQTFVDFLRRLPFYGLACVCTDDANNRQILNGLRSPVVTYGTQHDADIRATDIHQQAGVMRFKVCRQERDWLQIQLNLPGRHNVLNSLAAIAIGHELGVDDAAIVKSLESFQGINRRLQILGDVHIGAERVLVIDDYGHHPREIDAVIDAIRRGWPQRRLVVAFQPHRYSRTADLFEDFVRSLSLADSLILTEVYPAGEPPVANADGRSLSRAIRARGGVDPIFVDGITELLEVLPNVVKPGDIVLLLGAGSIGTVAGELEKRQRATGKIRRINGVTGGC